MPRLRRMSLLNVENLKMHFPVRGESSCVL